MNGNSNYPPGVSGNEPEITGDWPCTNCDGDGTEDGQSNCWYCGGSGKAPDDVPDCPSCGSHRTWFLEDLKDGGVLAAAYGVMEDDANDKLCDSLRALDLESPGTVRVGVACLSCGTVTVAEP